MVGTANENRTDTDTEEKEKARKKNTYEAVKWHHDSKALAYAIWLDINLVRTLSNFHTPKVVNEGLKRKRKVNGV